MKALGKIIRFFTSRSKVDREVAQQILRVRALPVGEAKQRALALIENPSRFETIRDSSSTNPAVGRLGPILQDFFKQFDVVREINGDFVVSRKLVGDSFLRPGFVKLGTDFAASELVCRPGDDEVFIVTDDNHILDGQPTIYHNICLLEYPSRA